MPETCFNGSAHLRVNQICTELLSLQICLMGTFIDSYVSFQVDDNIGLLISELNRTGLWGHINIMVTSDHGMAQCSADRLIRLDHCLHPDNYTVVDLSPVAAIFPRNGNWVYMT